MYAECVPHAYSIHTLCITQLFLATYSVPLQHCLPHSFSLDVAKLHELKNWNHNYNHFCLKVINNATPLSSLTPSSMM